MKRPSASTSPKRRRKEMNKQPEDVLGASAQTPRESPVSENVMWYEQTRDQYRPDTVRVLLIGESPPDPGDGERRFFYSPTLVGADNLFRGVALAAYGLTKEDLWRTPKRDVLLRLQGDGYWLIDAVEHPINLTADRRRATRSQKVKAIRAEFGKLLDRCKEAAPTVGVFICAEPVHAAVATPLTVAGISVLNKTAVPFPLGNTRAEFVALWKLYVPPR